MHIFNRQTKFARRFIQKFNRLRFFSVLILIVLTVAASAAAIAITGYARFNAATKQIKTEEEIPVSTEPEPLPSPGQEQTTVELITITPRGFEPNSIRRPAGRVILVVVNRSELPTMTLKLLSENGAVLGQTQLPRNRRRWSFPANLPAGRYRVVDASRPSVVCNIEITP
jgi:hypothetical protein